MADCPSIIRLSRRSMLAGGALAALPGFAARPAVALDAAGDGEARIAALAARFRQAVADLFDWMDVTEERHGPLAYEVRPEYRGRYDVLRAREAQACDALARARPASVRGLVLKLRPAFECESLCDAGPDCDSAILLPALRDLERLADGVIANPPPAA